jgi:hypothetical protein
MKEPKLKFEVDFKKLKRILNMAVMRGTLKKGDVIELIDEKAGISKRYKVKKVTNTDNNPHSNKAHISLSPFEYIEIETKRKSIKMS